jgi:DNA/RNA endonuclease G (NUC1)
MYNGIDSYVPEEYWKLLLVLLKHSLSKKKTIFNPEYNTDIKHSGNLMEYQILYITLFHMQWYYPKPSGNQMCKCVLFMHLK